MDFKTEILPWIKDLAVPISIVTAAGTYYYRSRSEERRMAKRVLYYLLEFRYSIRLSNISIPKSFANDILQSVKNALLQDEAFKGESGADVTFEQFEAPLHQMLTNLVQDSSALPAGFREAFYQSLDQLSERDPVAAYRLSGSEHIQVLFNALEGYKKETEALFGEILSHPVVEQFKQEAHKDAFDKELNELDDTIRWLAWRCSWRTRWRVRKVLRKAKLELSEKDRKQIEAQMKAVIPKIIELTHQLIAEGVVAPDEPVKEISTND